MTADNTPDIPILDLHDEPTVLDVDLGVRLGMSRPTNIRRTIERNIEELQSYGSLHAARAVIEAGKGARHEVTEYHLTESQALCLCQLSRAPRAADVRRMLITAFIEWRQGQAIQGETTNARQIEGPRWSDAASVVRSVRRVIRSTYPRMPTALVNAAVERVLARDFGIEIPVLAPAATPLPGPELLRRYHAFLAMEAHAVRVLTQQVPQPQQDDAVFCMFYEYRGDREIVRKPWTDAAARAPTVLTAAGIPVN